MTDQIHNEASKRERDCAWIGEQHSSETKTETDSAAEQPVAGGRGSFAAGLRSLISFLSMHGDTPSSTGRTALVNGSARGRAELTHSRSGVRA